jgi:hypothetical protein
MTDVLVVLIVGGLAAMFTYGGFLVGRERAEARCHNTIANLRRANMGLRSRIDRVEERNNRLARLLGKETTPPAELPEWMKP